MKLKKKQSFYDDIFTNKMKLCYYYLTKIRFDE